MARPPKTPPSSDIHGVNRDARVNTPDKAHPDPGGAIDAAHQGSAARPDESSPPGSATGKDARG